MSYFILPNGQETEGTIIVDWEGTFTNWSNDPIRDAAAVLQVMTDDNTVVAQGSQGLGQIPGRASTSISVALTVETAYIPVHTYHRDLASQLHALLIVS